MATKRFDWEASIAEIMPYYGHLSDSYKLLLKINKRTFNIATKCSEVIWKKIFKNRKKSPIYFEAKKQAHYDFYNTKKDILWLNAKGNENLKSTFLKFFSFNDVFLRDIEDIEEFNQNIQLFKPEDLLQIGKIHMNATFKSIKRSKLIGKLYRSYFSKVEILGEVFEKKERNDEELEELYKELDSLIDKHKDKIYEIYSVFRTLLIDYNLEESLITYYDISRVSEEILTGDVDILYLKTSAFNNPDRLSNNIDVFCQKGIIYKNLYLVYDQFCEHEDFVNTLINIEFDQKLRLDDFTVQFL